MVNTVVSMRNEKCPSEVSGIGILGPLLGSLFGGCIGGVFLLKNIHHWAWDSSRLFLLCDFYKGYELSDSCPCFQNGPCPWNHEIYKLLFLEIIVLTGLYHSSRKWQIWGMGGGENVSRTWRPWMIKRKEARPISDPCGQDWRAHGAVMWTGLFLLLT